MSAVTRPMHRVWQTIAIPVKKATTAQPMEPGELLEHMLGTYRTLRWVLFGIAVAFPLILPLLGLSGGMWPPQHSLSAYFYADHDKFTVLRTVFVGVLFAVGAALIAYQGYSRREDWALNVAGAAAICVALFPMLWPESPDISTMGSRYHVICAQLLFVMLFYVAVFRKHDTIHLLPKSEEKNRFKAIYNTTGWIMLLSPVSAWGLAQLTGDAKYLIILVEALGIWAFAAFWFFKSKEMEKSEFEHKVASQEMKMNSEGKAVAL